MRLKKTGKNIVVHSEKPCVQHSTRPGLGTARCLLCLTRGAHQRSPGHSLSCSICPHNFTLSPRIFYLEIQVSPKTTHSPKMGFAKCCLVALGPVKVAMSKGHKYAEEQ